MEPNYKIRQNIFYLISLRKIQHIMNKYVSLELTNYTVVSPKG